MRDVDQSFLKSFVTGPNTRIESMYKIPDPLPSVSLMNMICFWRRKSAPRKYDYYEKKLIEKYQGLVREYFGKWGSSAPPEIALAINEMARSYVQHEKCMHEKGYGTDPLLVSQRCRLYALVTEPEFVRWGWTVELLKILMGTKDFPFEIDMFDPDEGFDKEQIAGLHRIILCDELWKGKDHAIRRYFQSIATMLRWLSENKGLLEETLQPRIDLMRRNGGSISRCTYHPIWCKASFLKSEMDLLDQKAEGSEKLRSIRTTIIQEGLRYESHAC